MLACQRIGEGGREPNCAGKREQKTIKRLLHPTIVMITPSMPRSWGKPGHRLRAEYCRVKLMAHKPFNTIYNDREDPNTFETYMQSHDWDYVAAYEAFAKSPEAPAGCSDDFKDDVEVEDEGVVVGEERGEADQSFSIFETTWADELDRELKIDSVDWRARNETTYADHLLKDAASWQTRVKQHAQRG